MQNLLEALLDDDDVVILDGALATELELSLIHI